MSPFDKVHATSYATAIEILYGFRVMVAKIKQFRYNFAKIFAVRKLESLSYRVTALFV